MATSARQQRPYNIGNANLGNCQFLGSEISGNPISAQQAWVLPIGFGNLGSNNVGVGNWQFITGFANTGFLGNFGFGNTGNNNIGIGLTGATTRSESAAQLRTGILDCSTRAAETSASSTPAMETLASETRVISTPVAGILDTMGLQWACLHRYVGRRQVNNRRLNTGKL